MTEERNPLWWLGDELNRCLMSPGANVTIFGSAVMLLHGIVDDIGDVDGFITREAWATLAVRHRDVWRVKFPAIGDPPLLEWTGGERTVHLFERWTSRDHWLKVRHAWEKRELVNGWPCVPLTMVRDWKVAADKANPVSAVHAKHLLHVELINAHLEAANA